jgi:hypothetical protein
MNRSILIVICDFLLLSLLAFSTVDINKVADEDTPREVKVQMAANPPDSGKDLAAVMRLALDEERKGRDQLLSELAKARETAGKQQALLTQRERQIETSQQELQTREQEAARLQEEKTNLQARFTAAQTSIQALNQQLQSTSSEAIISREKLSSMEAEMRRQVQQAAALQSQLAQLARSNQVVTTEKQQLAGQLQIAEVEKRHATEQVTRMTEEVKVERAEKAQLAEGVKALASNSGELAKAVREDRALAPNTIFNEFITNRVEARLTASRPGLFGDSTKRKETETALVTDGTNTFALCHVQDTPLTFWDPGIDWEGLTGTLGHGTAFSQIHSLAFHRQDPRVILMPVAATEARRLGCKIYRLSPDPFKFQDAVLVGAREGYYGECKFEIDLATPDYLKLDHNFIKGLFGKFNPSRGDLVFSRTGELLGVMANSTYCLVLRNFNAGPSLSFDSDLSGQHTGELLSMLYSRVLGMPFKLQ